MTGACSFCTRSSDESYCVSLAKLSRELRKINPWRYRSDAKFVNVMKLAFVDMIEISLTSIMLNLH